MKLTISGQIPGRTLAIDVANLRDGELIAPENAPMALQPFEALGVDGRRYQEVGRRALPLVFETFRATDNVELMEQQSALAVGKLVQLRVVSPTRLAPFVFSDVLVISCRTLRRTGKMFGLGSSETARFTLVQEWVFDL